MEVIRTIDVLHDQYLAVYQMKDAVYRLFLIL